MSSRARLEHKDSSGGGGVIRPGEIQFMRAGSGVTHSEYNHSKSGACALPPDLDRPRCAWAHPRLRPAAPSTARWPRQGFVLLASRDGREDTVHVHQDVDLWVTLLAAGESRELSLRPGRHAWIHVARGAVKLNGTQMKAGDGAAVTAEASLSFVGREAAELLIFDLA